MDKKENPQTVRSKEWLTDALIQLMMEKKYTDISIKELTKRAGLDRKTFYRHFKSKDEILELPIRNAYHEYFNDLHNLPEFNMYDAVRLYFEMCIKHLNILKLLNSQGLLIVILAKLSEYIPSLNKALLDSPIYRKVSTWEYAYEAGGIWNITLLWISNGAKETAEEMAEIICSFMPPLYE